MKTRAKLLAAALATALTVLASTAAPAQQPSFATPEEAARALADAVRAEDPQAIAALMGPGSEEWLFTGDDVSDRAEWARFLAAWDEKNALERAGDDEAVLVVGEDDWPFPAPIVKDGDR